MSTRSLTRIIDSNTGSVLLTFFRHSDGYPEGHGKELAEFLDGFKIVNGIKMSDNGKIANGVGCLAAQLIHHFKNGPGGIYIYPTGSEDVGEEYIYTVRAPDPSIVEGRTEIECCEVRWGCGDKPRSVNMILRGDPAKFLHTIKALADNS